MSSIPDNQGRWYELLSPTQVLTGQQNNSPTVNNSMDSDYVTDNEEEFSMNTEEAPLKYQLKPLEEQVLSQKLSQLSTTSHQLNEHLNFINEDTNQNVPYYLSKESQSFQQVISHVQFDDLQEELRQMALLIHELFMINLQKSLWTTYLRAGTGQLYIDRTVTNDKINPQIWPIEVQQSMRKHSIKSTDHTTTLTYVTQYLDGLNKKMEQYQSKLNVKKVQLSVYLKTIETFVRQTLESARLETEHHIALVQYNYQDRILELKYWQHNPSQKQKQTFAQLTHAKYQEEITREEYSFLQHRLSRHQSSHVQLELAQEAFFNTDENQDLRENLYQQYINVALQAKEDMIELYVSSAKAQMERYRKQFHSKLKQFWLEQRSLSNDKKLTPFIIYLIEQRWKNISESVKCIYKHKFDLLHMNSVA